MPIKKIKRQENYQNFDSINGSHPIKDLLNDGCISYKARIRRDGEVVYFNWSLAKEMGLVPSDHDEKLNPTLINKLIETFSLQIINEFDIENNRVFDSEDIKEHTYMATRYLQLQHDSKTGKTSGDGRSIWNGRYYGPTKAWDISSCGTGATALSPATSKYGRFFETGDPTISYGCGYAEVEEGLATAVFSPSISTIHKTEKNLLIIKFKNNLAVNVRAHENLLRPSHFFLHLKQENHKNLKALTDYYIEDQIQAKAEWTNEINSRNKYNIFLKYISSTFAKMAANFEDHYIFCWLDWDGDNILMDGGIIDYGSVRQFGLCHSEYRYDDVERFSTNLLEQKNKAKYIVQNFAQAIDFIRSKEKKNIQEFTNHKYVNYFDDEFHYQKQKNILYHIGLSERKIKQVIKRRPELVDSYLKEFSFFERMKSEKGEYRCPDGITTDAIFNMRKFHKEFSILVDESFEPLSCEDFLDIVKSEYTPKNFKFTDYQKRKVKKLQEIYIELVSYSSKLFQESFSNTLKDIVINSQLRNKLNRLTGDGVTMIIEELMKHDLDSDLLNEVIEEITQNQLPFKQIKHINKSQTKPIMNKINSIILKFREGI